MYFNYRWNSNKHCAPCSASYDGTTTATTIDTATDINIYKMNDVIPSYLTQIVTTATSVSVCKSECES